MCTKAADILDLSVEERIQMVEDIWDSIAAVPEAVFHSPKNRKGSWIVGWKRITEILTRDHHGLKLRKEFETGRAYEGLQTPHPGYE